MADLIGQVTLLPPDQGGRQTPVYAGFSPVVKLPTGMCSLSVHFLAEDSLGPGETDAAMIEADPQETCQHFVVGQSYDLFDAARIIGRVTILENIWRDRHKSKIATLLRLRPGLTVRDAERSIAFYKLLGFQLVNDYWNAHKRVWANLRAGELELMISVAADANLAASAAPHAATPAISLYIHTDDVVTLHRQLLDKGLLPSRPRVTFYAMKEIEVVDPDGYRLCFAQATTEAPAAE